MVLERVGFALRRAAPSGRCGRCGAEIAGVF